MLRKLVLHAARGAYSASRQMAPSRSSKLQGRFGDLAVELAKKVFRERYHGALSIEGESNKKHSKKSCMALVDEMAMAAWNGLKLGETVFAHDTPITPMPRRRAREPQPYVQLRCSGIGWPKP